MKDVGYSGNLNAFKTFVGINTCTMNIKLHTYSF